MNGRDDRRDSEIREQRVFVDQLSRNPATKNGNLEAIARLITESCARLLGVERVGVWLFDDTETELRCIDQYNLSSRAHTTGAILKEHEFLTEFHALKTFLYVDASDPLTDPRTAGYVEGYLKPNHITSMLDVVVRFGGKNLGTLCFEHVEKPHTWQQHEIDFGCMVGAQLSVLLERRELRRTEDARREIQERLVATQELDALKSRFLANISHELRTPLTLLLGPVEVLLSGAKDAPTEWQRAEISTIHRSAQRLLEHVNALLYFVRIEAGRVNAAFEPADLEGLTREIVDLFGPTAAKAGIGLRVICEPLSEPAYVDRDMWEKIVSNLISNALKFTFTGEIVATLRLIGDRFTLGVRDTGIGIPTDALPHVFERFYRVPEARGRSVEGVGIGLALAKELVELHGGTIRVESTAGAGSTFWVEIPRGHAHLPPEQVRHGPRELSPREASWLAEAALGWLPEAEAGGAPAAAREAASASMSRAEPRERGERPHILVADDSAEMRTYLVRTLGEHYDVQAVADGAEALEAARARLPDLVISDVMMPRLDGIGLLRALRADVTTSTVPVVLVSARSGEDAAVEAMAARADDYLDKPFSVRELQARVATHLELSRTRREAAASALKDVFLGVAAHELRTPLTSLKLRIQIAQRKLGEPGALQAAAEQLAGVGRSIKRMEELVEELLSVSAIQSGQLSIRRERCDLAAICREAAAEESAALGRAVATDLPPVSVEAWVDRARIGEVVQHLISNALKYSPRDRSVWVSMREQGANVVIVVRDEGPGIPPEEVPHIFDRFYRVPGIDVRVGSRVGFGLGLYIAKAIVEQHGGRIDVETSRAQGSAFLVTLPRWLQ